MTCRWLKSAAYLILCSLMVSCTGVGGIGGGLGGGLGVPIDESGGSSGSETSPSAEPADNGLDTPINLPMGSIPIPTLRSNSLVYRTDSNGYTPVVGMAGTVDAVYRNDSHSMAVSTQPLDVAKAIHSIKQKQNLASLSMPRGLPFISSAFATDFMPHINLNADEGNIVADVNVNEMPADVCSMDGVACCPINDDGSFECYPFSSEDSYHIAVVEKKSGQQMAATEEEQNKNIRWFGYVPQDVGVDTIYGQPTLFGLGQEQGAKMLNVDGELRVSGNHKDHYFDFETEGSTRVAMANNRVALLKPAAGIALPTVTTQTIDNDSRDVTIIDESPPVTVPDAKSYTVLKRTHSGDLMFGVESKVSEVKGRIRNIDKNITIEFAGQHQPNTSFAINHRKTIAFDVQKNNVLAFSAIILFEDPEGKKRLRLATNDVLNFDPRNTIFGGSNPLNAKYDFKDVVIYKEDSLSVNMGHALLLDAKGSIYIIDMHLDNSLTRNYLTDTDEELSVNAIKVGKNPQALVLNKIKTKAYVANKDDDTISVIFLPLFDRTLTARDVQKTQANVKTINLKDYLPDKNITIKPTQLSYVVLDCQASLTVASEGLKGVLMVPLDEGNANGCADSQNVVGTDSNQSAQSPETVDMLPVGVADNEVIEVLPAKPLPTIKPIKPLKPIPKFPIKTRVQQPEVEQPADYEAPEVL